MTGPLFWTAYSSEHQFLRIIKKGGGSICLTTDKCMEGGSTMIKRGETASPVQYISATSLHFRGVLMFGWYIELNKMPTSQ